MNKADRKIKDQVVALLEQAKELLDPLATEEQDKADRLPDGIRSSERGEAIEGAAEHLGEARDSIDAALTELGEIGD